MRIGAAARTARTRLALGFVTLLCVAGAAAADEAIAANNGLKPFSASYAVEWKGITAGSTTLDLADAGGGRWTYRSRIVARGIFRLAFPDDITQTSTFTLTPEGIVRPLQYRGDDGSSDKKRDVALEFDWTNSRITGTSELKPVNLALEPGTQDAMSVQIAMIRELAGGREPTKFLMIDKNEIKDYVYAREGSARIKTAIGELDTVIWASHRPNSNRVTRMWYAPSLGFLPVKAERRRGDKVEFQMTLRSLKR